MSVVETSSYTRTIKDIPEPPRLPLIGQSLHLIYDPLAYIVEQYHALGPVFKMQMGFQNYVVLAGEDANRLLAREDSVLFESRTLFGGFADVANTDVMLVALDGDDHIYMRKLLRSGFARSAAKPHINELINIVNDYADSWQEGEELPILNAMRRIIVDQLGIVTTNIKPDGYFEDILHYLNTMMNTEVLKVYPPVMRKLPRFKQAKLRMEQLAQEVMDWHIQNPPNEDREADLIDTIINNNRPDGKPFTPADLVSLAVGPFFAGMDTLASTMAFYLLALLKQPQLLEEAKAEVDEFFRDGIPSLHEFRKLEILHAAGIETLRRYPVTPFTPRVVKEDFEFEGYHIPAGTEVMLAQTVTHFLAEFYPEPEKFDASRFMGDNRNRQANVFTPFTVGAHSCLGAGLAEIQMLVTMAALLHKVDFDSLPDSFNIKIHTQPLPNPGDVKVRVKGLRR